jgi:hypothetical protein
MGVDVELKRKITVNGQEYGSLDEIPDEFRTAVQNALASGAVAKTTIYVNGKTYASMDEVPAPLRAVVAGLTSLAAKPLADAEREMREAVRPEPILSFRRIVVAIGLAAVLLWLARLLF